MAAAPPVHIAPPWLLLAVWAALVIGTLVTVSVPWAEDRYHFELGAAGLWVALGIATFKATLVLLYFMHLRHEKPLNILIFVTALLFLTLFMGLTLMDASLYQPDIRKRQEDLEQREQAAAGPAALEVTTCDLKSVHTTPSDARGCGQRSCASGT